jgi:DNA-binding MurR/RpiR family transcriptional regulator
LERTAVPLAAREERPVHADVSNDNLDEALEDIRHTTAGLRDELFERLAEALDEPRPASDRPTG